IIFDVVKSLRGDRIHHILVENRNNEFSTLANSSEAELPPIQKQAVRCYRKTRCCDDIAKSDLVFEFKSRQIHNSPLKALSRMASGASSSVAGNDSRGLNATLFLAFAFTDAADSTSRH